LIVSGDTVPFTSRALRLRQTRLVQYPAYARQQVVFLDFDNRGRTREIVVQVMGE
jgi:thiamine phosphate synthase YjbQ (UPF0047 family)